MRNNFAFISLLCLFVTLSCVKDGIPATQDSGKGVMIMLAPEDYAGSGNDSRSASEQGPYDYVDILIADEAGNAFRDIKSIYFPETSELQIEGLREGNYSLMVLAARGDMESDRVKVNSPSHVSEVWISFPEDLHRPLSAEYFYSKTDFRVVRNPGPDGYAEEVIIPSSISQTRIVSRLDVRLDYNNDDVRTAAVVRQLTFAPFVCATQFTADGNYSGESDGIIDVLDIADDNSLIFMPSVGSSSPRGTLRMVTESYIGPRIENEYTFSSGPTRANRIDEVVADIIHPNDNMGTRYVTSRAYDEGGHSKILQDGESKLIYADRSQREFNTSEPLQVSLTEDGRLHVRFYSPKRVGDVLIRARIPSEGDEFFDLAYFESIPDFADFFGDIHLTRRPGIYRAESGRIMEIRKYDPDELGDMEFDIVSSDPYWAKIRQIKHGWTIYFSLYGGDPDLPDGGPNNNWMGIRPVHCREAVAFFLNFTYMIDMKEHEDILKANEDILYGNGGVNDKVTADKVLSQMRQKRSLQIGLVYPGKGVYGLGGGIVFGVYQKAWLTHYSNYYSCEVMFHELGHVMGYTHNSSFTYGPWAQKLMNRFYVDNLDLMPVESAEYLDSSNNSFIYI